MDADKIFVSASRHADVWLETIDFGPQQYSHAEIIDAFDEVDYRYKGERPLVLVVDDPAHVAMALFIGAIALTGGRFANQPRGHFVGHLATQLVSQTRGQLGGQFADRLRDRVWRQLRGYFCGQRRDWLANQLTSRLRVWDRIEGQGGLAYRLNRRIQDQLCGRSVYQFFDRLERPSRDKLQHKLLGQLEDQLQAQLWAWLRVPLDSDFQYPIWDRLRGQFRRPLQQQIIQIGARIESCEPWHCVWDVYLAAFYSIICAQIPNQDHWFGKIDLYPIYKAGAWALINLGGLVVVVTRPEAHRDQQWRLHNKHGPAISWGEQKSYWWHGAQVPEEWIIRDELSPAIALNWDNAEQRRAACEILGWDAILSHSGAKMLQRDDLGELYSVDLPDAEGQQFVRVKCGTGRTFAMPVPNSCQTAAEAVALTYGLEPKDYTPEVRT